VATGYRHQSPRWRPDRRCPGPGVHRRRRCEPRRRGPAIGPSRIEDDGTRFADSIADLANTLGHRRLLVVGGTGSLTVNGVRLLDTPEFPEIHKAEALKGTDSLALLRAAADDIDWTYLSPAPVILPGQRTGSYRVELETPAGDQISIED
jgi:putative NADH-flavin reductase